MIYIQLFISFLQVGLFSFGGGYAALPLIQEQIVDKLQWLSIQEFGNLITISQMTPGPIAINASTFVGMQVGGLLGAIIATIGCILPACILVTLFMYFYLKYKNLSIIKRVLYYIRPVVAVAIFTSGLNILLESFDSFINYRIIILKTFIFLLSIIVFKKYNKSPIVVMVIAGVSYLILNLFII